MAGNYNKDYNKKKYDDKTSYYDANLNYSANNSSSMGGGNNSGDQSYSRDVYPNFNSNGYAGNYTGQSSSGNADSYQRSGYNNRNNNSGGGGGGGGNSYYNKSNQGYNRTDDNYGSDVTVQRDTIFIQNLPKTVTNDDLAQNFGSIGVIKIEKRTSLPKIWIYKDKTTGEGKGEATVTYDDEAAASAAIEWFNEKQIMGNIVKVQLATRKASTQNSNYKYQDRNKGKFDNKNGQQSNRGGFGKDNRSGRDRYPKSSPY